MYKAVLILDKFFLKYEGGVKSTFKMPILNRVKAQLRSTN